MAGSAIEEWLRYDGPSGAFARVAAADLEMGGRTIREGQRVFAFMNSANRDPEAFDDPERFDIGRTQNPHMTFGHGIHFCLGAPLARLESEIAATRLAERLPQIRLQGGEPEWHDSLILRGVKSLPVVLCKEYDLTLRSRAKRCVSKGGTSRVAHPSRRALRPAPQDEVGGLNGAVMKAMICRQWGGPRT